jgi:hypothetical protein
MASAARSNAPCPEVKVTMIRRSRIVGKALISGALAAFVGIMLRIFGPCPVAGFPIDPHQYADVIIGMGLCILAAGILVRVLRRN